MTAVPFETDPGPAYPDRLPTLTEVLELGGAEAGPLDVSLPVPPVESSVWDVPASTVVALRDGADAAGMAEMASMASMAEESDGDGAEEGPDEQALSDRVLQELAPRLEVMFESRLNDAVALAMASAVELVMRESRVELSDALRELVDEAVARALSQRRPP
jgi:hypothetical protein